MTLTLSQMADPLAILYGAGAVREADPYRGPGINFNFGTPQPGLTPPPEAPMNYGGGSAATGQAPQFGMGPGGADNGGGGTAGGYAGPSGGIGSGTAQSGGSFDRLAGVTDGNSYNGGRIGGALGSLAGMAVPGIGGMALGTIGNAIGTFGFDGPRASGSLRGMGLDPGVLSPASAFLSNMSLGLLGTPMSRQVASAIQIVNPPFLPTLESMAGTLSPIGGWNTSPLSPGWAESLAGQYAANVLGDVYGTQNNYGRGPGGSPAADYAGKDFGGGWDAGTPNGGDMNTSGGQDAGPGGKGDTSGGGAKGDGGGGWSDGGNW